MEFTGAELIVELMARHGIRIIAGIPGGANLPLYDALSRSGKIRHVLARHEQGAGFIAQGMARATGAPQVCLATSGPGATNILTALADAKLDSVPVICITGQVASHLIGTSAFQEVDAAGLAASVTKKTFFIRSAEQLLHAVPDAFRIAMSGRPGPVLIDVPKDVQLQKVRCGRLPDSAKPDPLPQLDMAGIRRAARMIAAAKRPVLYVGGGVRSSKGAVEALAALAEKGSIPTAMTLMGLGVLPCDHPLSLGMIGMHAARHTHMALEMCDLLVAVGVRFDDRATGRIDAFCPSAKVVHIDVDAGEIHKLKRAQVGIVGDAGKVLKALVPLLPSGNIGPWCDRVNALKRRFDLIANHRIPSSAAGLIGSVSRVLDKEDFIATDVGQHQMWTAQAFPFRRAGQLLTSGGLGTMGFGLPAAIGAALVHPDRTVVCVSGDGSLMMNIQEMATAVEENVNCKILLLNNNALGLVHQQQVMFYSGRTYASTFRRQVDFLRIAEGFGMETIDLSGRTDPGEAIGRALQRKGPCLIHAPIHVGEMVSPMVPPGAANRDAIDEVCCASL